MEKYICIDGGTTNTRISLVANNSVIDTLKYNIGARNGIENNSLLKNTIKGGIAELLLNNHLCEDDIIRILASGMITSEFGLVDLSHITAPVGINDLHNRMYETELTDISSIPFVFMRGVKTNCNSIKSADMMRGEETELMGVLQGEGVYILLGSHSKIIEVDTMGRIINFRTTLTGEMISALSENTILKNSIELKKQSLNTEFLLKGFEYSKENGINNALFKVRVLKNIFNLTANEIYSFYMGIVLCDEISYVLSLKTTQILVTGRSQIKEAVVELLSKLTNIKIVTVSDKDADNSTSMGMVKIYKYKKQCILQK